MHQDAPHLDGKYASFGMVTSGMDVVDKICSEVPQGVDGAVNAWERPIIDSVTVRDAGAEEEQPEEEEPEEEVVYYTVTILDEAGVPVSGVNLQICTDGFCLPSVTTDGTGTAVYEFDSVEEFKIQINSVPEGYVLPTEKLPFTDGTEATIILEKEVVDEAESETETE